MTSQKKTSKLPDRREKVSSQGTIGLTYASHWLRGWCEFSRERSLTKPVQYWITQGGVCFDKPGLK